jgi:pimeloyl-ACP methyl ester carboxylesterase
MPLRQVLQRLAHRPIDRRGHSLSSARFSSLSARAPFCTRYLGDGGVRKAVRWRAMRLSHQRRGAGPPLVLIHGIGSQWQVWEPVLDGLSASRDVIALDLPGFGESLPLDREVPTVAALARAVAAFVADLGLERPAVAGNSLGGAVALELGRMGAVCSVCALSPFGFGRGWETTLGRFMLRSTRLTARAARPITGPLAKRPGTRRALCSHVMAHPERVSPAEMAGATRAIARAPAFRATLHAMDGWDETDKPAPPCPTTIAWGERDRLLFYRPQSARARATLPGARHVTLTGCGHIPTWDDPRQVERVLLDASS